MLEIVFANQGHSDPVDCLFVHAYIAKEST
jgi:hypothetical protein